MKCVARLPLALAAMLAAAPALAQGTAEQQEACAPDAVKLCQDTIPDIPKTTACMKAHFAELSPRCQTAFNDFTKGGGKGAGKASRRSARRQEAAPPPAAAPADTGETDDLAAAPEAVPGMRAYRAYIRQSCRDGLIDSFTCRSTLDALKGDE